MMWGKCALEGTDVGIVAAQIALIILKFEQCRLIPKSIVCKQFWQNGKQFSLILVNTVHPDLSLNLRSLLGQQ